MVMGSPVGLLMANAFMCHLGDQVSHDDLMPELHRRYVDVRMPNTDVATEFFTTLNGQHQF